MYITRAFRSPRSIWHIFVATIFLMYITIGPNVTKYRSFKITLLFEANISIVIVTGVLLSGKVKILFRRSLECSLAATFNEFQGAPIDGAPYK